MIRKAFVLQLRPGAEDEYVHRHSPIWPELEQVLQQHGAHNYSIFLHPGTGQLFGYVELESAERWGAIAHTAVQRRWRAYMQDIIAADSDGTPQAVPLREVFHLP